MRARARARVRACVYGSVYVCVWARARARDQGLAEQGARVVDDGVDDLPELAEDAHQKLEGDHAQLSYKL